MAFAFTVILLLLSLELAIVRRLIWPRWSDVPFFLNHVGVWLILAGMAFGGGDFRRLRVVLHESGADGGVTVSEGYDAGDSEQAKPLPLPFTLRLDGFLLQEYPPELVLIDNYSGEPVGGRAAKTLTAKTGAKGRLDSWNVTVTDFLPKAVPSGPLEYMTAGDRGGIAAAKLTAVGADGSRVEGWISVDRAFNLGDRSIAMTIPQPKLFHSDIVLDPGTAEERSLAVEVNHPGAAKGWRIYQSGYDPGQGKGTQVSILELIRDPWLPVVYSGIFMLLGGCLSLLGFGFKRRTAEESP